MPWRKWDVDSGLEGRLYEVEAGFSSVAGRGSREVMSVGDISSSYEGGAMDKPAVEMLVRGADRGVERPSSDSVSDTLSVPSGVRLGDDCEPVSGWSGTGIGTFERNEGAGCGTGFNFEEADWKKLSSLSKRVFV